MGGPTNPEKEEQVSNRAADEIADEIMRLK
jgi:hypothetical protein